jgi:hypothetical protein
MNIHALFYEMLAEISDSLDDAQVEKNFELVSCGAPVVRRDWKLGKLENKL